MADEFRALSTVTGVAVGFAVDTIAVLFIGTVCRMVTLGTGTTDFVAGFAVAGEVAPALLSDTAGRFLFVLHWEEFVFPYKYAISDQLVCVQRAVEEKHSVCYMLLGRAPVGEFDPSHRVNTVGGEIILNFNLTEESGVVSVTGDGEEWNSYCICAVSDISRYT